MKQPYNLPLLPVSFTPETELSFYKKVVEATSKLEKLKQKMNDSLVSESFMALLTLQESVQSTRIEGTQVTFSEMLEDEMDQGMDWEKIEVRNYRRALQIGVEAINTGYPVSERLLRRMHSELMAEARGSKGDGGEYRKVQNFIGPSKDIKDASYIPPEPQYLGEYMSNLEHFINGHPYKQQSNGDLHGLIKTAIVHAQFESIHPFLDGNGRLGRILIVLHMMKENLIDSPSFFLSEELEKERFRYYALLNGVRGVGEKTPNWENWIHFFLDATIRMAEKQYNKLDQAEDLYHEGLQKLSSGSSKHVWGMVMKFPITSVKQVEHHSDLAASTIRKAFRELTDKQMVFSDDRQRNKRFFQYDLIRIMTD
ncbi:Fic family protein [Salisediminibacterium beveridgei]|uniref:Fido domain-containing protein n=1 Tax=Salisediminibacterium beveridgei TaxID=632773 RepID=A0A1D7QZK9_9BACI|nr:Fic family protein [Salisediminibacterium beveridgei]AOM84443.1 hypothetical protein BBEV_3126 [Salisediminibacterium beveridgei]